MRRLLIASLLVLLHPPVWADGQTTNLPDPKDDATLTKQATPQTAILAGGCFWGVQAVFQHVKGVISATSGYAGGSAATANYETVSSGASGHAETVKVIYDPATIS
jgi:peptide-methionine (S)-S-oxide reductase